jgi:predicted DNA-binding antitoxin AbrB/MazE fold protein
LGGEGREFTRRRGRHVSLQSMRVIEARYEEGHLTPESPLALQPGERVGLILLRRPDPKRWDMAQLAKSGTTEDLDLARQGLGDWAEALDREDAG